MGRFLAAALLCALVFMLLASTALAKEPPNENDPCSRAGRNTCGTLGVGFYREYRYGIRWFGDFRRAVPGDVRSFCLDLRYWYASPAYRYREVPGGRLRNTDGEVVPLERQQRIAFAIWRYGRSTRPKQQAAVALYVHSLMGDARPGEADAASLGEDVASLYERIARDAARYHGPYRIQTRFVGSLSVGAPTRLTVRVLSAAGNALPDVQLSLSAQGANVPRQIRTNAQGIADVPLTPTEAGRLRLSVSAGAVASTLPKVFRPTTRVAARNGQRLAAPSSQRVSAVASAPVRATPTLTSAASAEVVRPGTPIFDRIGVRGLGDTSATLQVELFGPFPSRSAMRCEGRPSWTGRMTARGDGMLRSPSTKVEKAGFYTYRVRLVGSALVAGYTTECALRTSTVLGAPKIVTGSGEVAKDVAAKDNRGTVPTRVRVASVGIDARVSAVGIDVASGSVGLPRNIARAGWWRDGTAPGASAGAILISAHVDSERRGPGAFFTLHRTRPGDRVQVTTAGGRTFAYRVVSIRNYRKEALPRSIFSRRGPARLVLVTCGGPFDQVAGSYRDNVVLTAVPTSALT